MRSATFLLISWTIQRELANTFVWSATLLLISWTIRRKPCKHICVHCNLPTHLMNNSKETLQTHLCTLQPSYSSHEQFKENLANKFVCTATFLFISWTIRRKPCKHICVHCNLPTHLMNNLKETLHICVHCNLPTHLMNNSKETLQTHLCALQPSYSSHELFERSMRLEKMHNCNPWFHLMKMTQTIFHMTTTTHLSQHTSF